MSSQDLIRLECATIRDLLLQKNEEYGDSAINPLRIFSTADTVEQINVRIDDKLSRIKNHGPKAIKEDTIQDLIGYLILRRVAERKELKGQAIAPEPNEVMFLNSDNFTITKDQFDEEWRSFWQDMEDHNE